MDVFTDISLFTAPDLRLKTNHSYYSKNLQTQDLQETGVEDNFNLISTFNF